jgi:hypothetical protein
MPSSFSLPATAFAAGHLLHPSFTNTFTVISGFSF